MIYLWNLIIFNLPEFSHKLISKLYFYPGKIGLHAAIIEALALTFVVNPALEALIVYYSIASNKLY